MRKLKTGSLAAAADTVVLPLAGDTLGFVGVNGTYTGGQVVLEGSMDGTTYYALNAYRTDSLYPDFGTITLASSQTKGWNLFTGGLLFIRVRCVAISTGSISVTALNGPGISPVSELGVYGLVNQNVAKVVVNATAGTTTEDAVVVASGPGILHRLIVNTAGTASLGIFDHASSSSGLSALYASPATYAQGTITELNIPFTNGLVAGKANGSAAVTVGYSLV